MFYAGEYMTIVPDEKNMFNAAWSMSTVPDVENMFYAGWSMSTVPDVENMFYAGGSMSTASYLISVNNSLISSHSFVRPTLKIVQFQVKFFLVMVDPLQTSAVAIW